MDNKEEYYERGDIFIWDGDFYILTSVPQNPENFDNDAPWLFYLVALDGGNRLEKPIIKMVGTTNKPDLELSCMHLKKNNELFKPLGGAEVKKVLNSNMMVSIIKTLKLIEET